MAADFDDGSPPQLCCSVQFSPAEDWQHWRKATDERIRGQLRYVQVSVWTVLQRIDHRCVDAKATLELAGCVTEARYLGIMVTDGLSWSSHVQSIYSKANSTLGFLRRNLRRCPAKLKESAYIWLVRSKLEYAASVWDPHLAKDINKLENIQRRSARFVKGDYRTTSSVTQMLPELGWQD